MTWSNPQDRLIAYVEGLLPDDMREAFERELAASAELRHALDTLRRADRSLASQLSPPDAISVDLPAIGPATPAPARRSAAWSRWGTLVGGAIAASVVLVFALQFINDRFIRPQPGALALSTYFDSIVAGGMTPDYVCKDDAEFVDYSRKAFGLPLLARGDATVEIIGWTGYGETLKHLGVSRGARTILARVDGRPVVVLIDRADSGAPGPRLDSNAKGRLQLFTRRLDGLVLYEITPLSRPAAVDRFSVPRDR